MRTMAGRSAPGSGRQRRPIPAPKAGPPVRRRSSRRSRCWPRSTARPACRWPASPNAWACPSRRFPPAGLTGFRGHARAARGRVPAGAPAPRAGPERLGRRARRPAQRRIAAHDGAAALHRSHREPRLAAGVRRRLPRHPAHAGVPAHARGRGRPRTAGQLHGARQGAAGLHSRRGVGPPRPRGGSPRSRTAPSPPRRCSPRCWPPCARRASPSSPRSPAPTLPAWPCPSCAGAGPSPRCPSLSRPGSLDPGVLSGVLKRTALHIGRALPAVPPVP